MKQLQKDAQALHEYLSDRNRWAKGHLFEARAGREWPRDSTDIGAACLDGAARIVCFNNPFKPPRHQPAARVKRYRALCHLIGECIDKHFPRSRYKGIETFNDSRARKHEHITTVTACAVEQAKREV